MVIFKEILIKDMTCLNCETRIEGELSSLPGIVEVNAIYALGSVKVSFDDEIITLDEIIKSLNKIDYHLKDKVSVNYIKILTKLILIILLLVVAILLMNEFGIFNYLNFFPKVDSNVKLSLLFVIGLLTSVHCVVMCGGINISVNLDKSSDSPKKLSKTTFISSLLYNGGRVISYTIVGFIVGAIGSVFNFSEGLKGIIGIIAGIFMIIMGLNFLNVLPFLKKLVPHMPKSFTRKINNLKKKNNLPFIIGLLNGLMPCGPLAAMQIYALSTGSPLLGALSMLLFSLGTVPLMFIVGSVSTLLSEKFNKKILFASSILIIFLGLVMFNNGASLSGITYPSLFSYYGEVIEAEVDYSANVQYVEFDLEANNYRVIKVHEGIPVVWVINTTSQTLNSCNQTIKVGLLSITKTLELGKNYIEFTPNNVGNIGYHCSMGMISSKIIVYK